MGDGECDDTSALQATVDAGSGSEVVIQRGIYCVNADVGIQLRSGTVLRMEDGAVLQALPSAKPNYNILRCFDVENVRVTGGVLRGERTQHLNQTGEFGMGLGIYGSRHVTVERIRVESCWGDGVYVGYANRPGSESSDVILRGVVSINNRRQGLSITGCRRLLVQDCLFTSTRGTPPQAGVDMEPDDLQVVEHVTLQRCRFANNAGHGVMTGGNGRVRDVKIQACRAAGNALDGFHIELATNVSISECIAQSNGQHGITLNRSNHNVVSRNQCAADAAAAETAEILLTNGSSDNIIEQNECRRSRPRDGVDIRIDARNCERNVLRGNHGATRTPASVADAGIGTRFEQ